MGAFKDRFEMGLQTWSLCHYPDHDYILAATEELGITRVDIGNCHFEFIADRPSCQVIDGRIRWLNEHTADDISLRYEGERDFPEGSFLEPFILATRSREAGAKAEVVFSYRATDYASLAAKYAANGVRIHTFGPLGIPGRPEDCEAQARRVFELAKACGVDFFELHMIRAHEIPILEALQKEYGIRVTIHNHGKDHAYGRIVQLKPLLENTSFGFSLDTAWAVDAGEDPVEMVRAFHDRLVSVHCKEFEYDEDGSWHGVVSGSGTFDLPGLMRLLNDVGYTGLFALEYEGFERDSITPLKQSKAAVEELLAALN